MKNYEIWQEGFQITGNSSPAIFVAIIKANSFKDACDKHFKDNELYNPKNLTVWGCKLFNNERQARKNFG